MGLTAVVSQGSNGGVETVQSTVPIDVGVGTVFVCVGVIFLLTQIEIRRQIVENRAFARTAMGVLLIPFLFGFGLVLLFKSFKVVGVL